MSDPRGHRPSSMDAPPPNAEKTRSTTRQRIKTILLGPSSLCTLLLIAAGTAVAVQSGTNAAMRSAGGRSFSALINFATGLTCCIILFGIDLLLFKTPPPTSSGIKASPWYSWFGGALGAYYIVINILTIPKHGAGTVLSIFVCSQVIMACLMDHFALTGVPKRKFSLYRILASLGMIGCVAVITLF
ncbi:hypothetical protein BX666DRAFT_873349 [Dichotomocladium elegans]|nr:hypothetical protein BX666DRAFT_873349 [Dichotomocladium elegans]